jgi:hypothetical protein
MFKEFDRLIKLSVPTVPLPISFILRLRFRFRHRISTSQQRFNHCLLAHIYKEKLDAIDPAQKMSIFISSNEKRQGFFG